MKTNKLYPVFLFLTLTISGFAFAANAQEVKPTKEEKKAMEKAVLEANFNIIDSLLKVRSFVLVADFLQDKYGNRVPVSGTLNFIKLNNPTGILQTGSDSSQGTNYVGGGTAEGTIRNFKINKDFKKLTYSVSFTLMTQIGIYDINMQISSNSSASATITGTFPGQLTWDGHIKTVGNARVFKGLNSI
jgi:hypothetical protein